jgi:DNA polymerase-3 subunit alpha
LASIANINGFYYVPRIDKNIVEKYKEYHGTIRKLIWRNSGKILNLGENQAEEALVWWKQQFGADFYLEIMRHNQEDENRVNKTLIEFAQKHTRLN